MNKRRSAGLTLLELLLATADTALVAAAVGSMMSAVSYGTSSRNDLRSLVVKEKISTTRITAAIRSSAVVLGVSSNALVLWMNDDDGSGAPNLSEIRLIERNAAAKQVSSYKAPDTLLPASDTEYPLAGTNFITVTAGLKGTADFPQELWVTDVSAWTISLNNVITQSATLVSMRLTLDMQQHHEIAIAAAALRNR